MNFEERIKVSHELYDVSKQCFMCREPIGKKQQSVEDVFPKWLMNKYKLWDTKLVIPNGSTMPYRMFRVPCCKKCNNERMSSLENKIKRAVELGYDEFIKLDKNLIAWWIAKIYYAKVLKELTIRMDLKNPDSRTIISEKPFIDHYGNIHMLMNELLIGTTFEGDPLYELYVYKTDDYPVFDYLDNIDMDVIYMKMDNIIILCSFFPTKTSSMRYKQEIDILGKQEIVSFFQVLELYTKIVFYKSYHIGEYAFFYDADMNVGKVDVKQVLEVKRENYDFESLRMALIVYLKSRYYPDEIPSYDEEKEISLILYGASETMTIREIYCPI